ncbi:MAG: hypothetical protein ACE5R6_19600 [Candidatus Heimdallarchaeota archaeon]
MKITVNGVLEVRRGGRQQGGPRKPLCDDHYKLVCQQTPRDGVGVVVNAVKHCCFTGGIVFL